MQTFTVGVYFRLRHLLNPESRIRGETIQIDGISLYTLIQSFNILWHF